MLVKADIIIVGLQTLRCVWDGERDHYFHLCTQNPLRTL
jgi:hypothetical protein